MAEDSWDEMRHAPAWARHVDEAGHRTWPKRPSVKRAELVFSIVANVVVLVVAQLHDVWRPWTFGVVTPAFAEVVWAVTLTCVVTIAGSALLLFFPFRLARHAVGLAMAVANLVSTAAFYQVFPFDFGRVGLPWMNGVLHLVMLIVLIVGGIGVAVRAIRLLFSSSGD